MPFPPLSTKQLTKDPWQTNQGRDFNSFLGKILYNHVLGDSWDFCPWHHAGGFMDLWNRITPHSWFLSSLCWCPHPPQLVQPSLQAHHLPHQLPPYSNSEIRFCFLSVCIITLIKQNLAINPDKQMHDIWKIGHLMEGCLRVLTGHESTS